MPRHGAKERVRESLREALGAVRLSFKNHNDFKSIRKNTDGITSQQMVGEPKVKPHRRKGVDLIGQKRRSTLKPDAEKSNTSRVEVNEAVESKKT